MPWCVFIVCEETHHHHHHLHPWHLKVRATSLLLPHRQRVTAAAAFAAAVRRDHCRKDSVCAHRRHTKDLSGVVCTVAPQRHQPIGWNAPNRCLLISMWFLTPLVDHDHAGLLVITQIKPIYIEIVSYNYVFMCSFLIWYIWILQLLAALCWFLQFWECCWLKLSSYMQPWICLCLT